MASVSYVGLRREGRRLRLRRLQLGGTAVAVALLAGSLVVAALLRLAMREAGASAIAEPLDLPGTAGAASAASTWGYVLFESSLLPHPILGTGTWTWGGGSLVLTLMVLWLAFRAAQRSRGSLQLVGVVAPTLLVGLTAGAAELVTDGASRPLELAALAVALPAIGVLAALAWELLRHQAAAAPWLRAAASAGLVIPIGTLLAALPVLLLAPAGNGPAGTWLGLLAPYFPNAILRAAFEDGLTRPAVAALACYAVAAVLAAVHLHPRSLRERSGFMLATAIAAAGLTVAATPAVSFVAALDNLGRALPAALVVGAAGAVFGPLLGATAAGHRLAGVAVLRALGDRLPPRPATELTAQDMFGARPGTHERIPVYSGTRSVKHAGRALLAAAALVVVVSVLVVGVVTLTGTTGGDTVPPELTAAHAYLDAAATNDASRIWPLVTVDASALPTTAAPRLLGRDDLARMLAVPGNQRFAISRARLTLSGRAGAVTLVRAEYEEAGVAQDETLHLVSIGGGWKVVLPAAAISLAGADRARVEVDGAPVALVAGQPVFVLPGVHSLQASYPAPFQSARISVVSDQPYPAATSASISPRLDDSAFLAAQAAVAAAFQRCAAASTGRVAGCPQAVDAPAGEAVRWTLVGDPSASLSITPDASGVISATGTFAMVAAYAVHVPEDVKHVASAGSFRTSLSYTGGAWSAGALVTGSTPTTRPAVADAELLAAVRSGFDRCLASRLLRPADCPQTLPSQFYVKDVAWRLDGDPLNGAQAGFDAARRVLTVSGVYAMTCSYTEGGQPKTGPSSGHYRADLLWDGSKVVLVAINRG